MKVINLIGGPNTGKSTTALGLSYFMKKAGLRVELVTEYAKDMVYEERDNILGDQLYILAKQNRRMSRLRSLVDWVITDAPLILGGVYANGSEPDEFLPALEAYWNLYENQVFVLPRDTSFCFQKEGRIQQSHEEAEKIDRLVNHAVYSVEASNVYVLQKGNDYVTQILEFLGLDALVSTALEKLA